MCLDEERCMQVMHRDVEYLKDLSVFTASWNFGFDKYATKQLLWLCVVLSLLANAVVCGPVVPLQRRPRGHLLFSSNAGFKEDSKVMSDEETTSISSPRDEEEETKRVSRDIPRWSQPCPYSAHLGDTSEPVSVADLSSNITVELKVALRYLNGDRYLEGFKEKFVMETFSRSWQEQIEDMEGFMLDFMDAVPGTVDESQTFDEFLASAYVLLQQRAVGIEQTTLDQALYSSNFLSEFRKIESQIVAILCEIHVAMVRRSVDVPVSVTRAIMNENYRDVVSAPGRDRRDMAILREYHSLLNYFLQGFLFWHEQG